MRAFTWPSPESQQSQQGSKAAEPAVAAPVVVSNVHRETRPGLLTARHTAGCHMRADIDQVPTDSISVDTSVLTSVCRPRAHMASRLKQQSLIRYLGLCVSGEICIVPWRR